MQRYHSTQRRANKLFDQPIHQDYRARYANNVAIAQAQALPIEQRLTEARCHVERLKETVEIAGSS